MSIAALIRSMAAAGASLEEVACAVDAIENPPIVARRNPSNWSNLRAYVFERDNWTCQYCGADERSGDIDFHCDHVIPLSRGGSNAIENLATSCAPCNLSKGARTPAEWLQ